MNEALKTMISPTQKDFYILDIDSTLVMTQQRNQQIVDDWIQLNSSLYPEDCESLKKMECRFGDYGLGSAKQRIQFREKNLGSQADLDKFWREHFFSNNYLHMDMAMKGAVGWTQKLYKRAVGFVYLTARHKGAMWEGTLSSMQQLGFPISPEILFLKQDLSDSDAIYKTKQMQKLVEKHGDKRLWFIDNEPVVLHQIIQDHPQVKSIYFESTHSGKKQPPGGLPTISDFSFTLTAQTSRHL